MTVASCVTRTPGADPLQPAASYAAQFDVWPRLADPPALAGI